MSRPVSSVVAVSSTSIETLVDAYIAQTFHRFERVLVASVPGLGEPAVANPARAARIVDGLVETLVGFAVGSAFGLVATAVRNGFGAQVRTELDRSIGKLKAGATFSSIPNTTDVPRFFADRAIADRKPLLDQLGSQLQSRLCHASAEARRHVLAIHAAVAKVAPEQLAQLASTLELLAADDAAAIAFGDQLGFGWAHFVAAATNAAAPQIPHSARWQRTSQLWRTWFTKVTGKQVLAELSQDQVVAAGFVVRIG